MTKPIEKVWNLRVEERTNTINADPGDPPYLVIPLDYIEVYASDGWKKGDRVRLITILEKL